MKSVGFLFFLRSTKLRDKVAFLQFGTICEENKWGVQRGKSPRLWISNRGEQHPCWHTILLAKSSVLYPLSAGLRKVGDWIRGVDFEADKKSFVSVPVSVTEVKLFD